MVRTRDEWAKHPQAAAIASLPLMEIVKIGASRPEPLPAGDRPLSGVRVLDLTRVLAGPTCARTLAEHGADVLKITAAHLPNIGYQDTGHGKLSANLDLRQPKDLDTLRWRDRGCGSGTMQPNGPRESREHGYPPRSPSSSRQRNPESSCMRTSEAELGTLRQFAVV